MLFSTGAISCKKLHTLNGFPEIRKSIDVSETYSASNQIDMIFSHFNINLHSQLVE